MTGQPSFTFRGKKEKPICRNCGKAMVFVSAHRPKYRDEHDFYECRKCRVNFVDFWSY